MQSECTLLFMSLCVLVDNLQQPRNSVFACLTQFNRPNVRLCSRTSISITNFTAAVLTTQDHPVKRLIVWFKGDAIHIDASFPSSGVNQRILGYFWCTKKWFWASNNVELLHASLLDFEKEKNVVCKVRGI